MADRLRGKVAIITGGVSGIGLASSELFVAEGAKVVAADIQDDLGAALQKRFPQDLLFVHTDVTSEKAVASLVERTVEHFGKLDVMFNNAGAGGDFSPLLELTPEGFDRTSALLIRAVLLGHRYAGRQFQKQKTGGSIISTASAASLQGGWAPAAYTACKHAVLGLVRQAVAELAPLGIRSNALCPGVILTPIVATTFGVPAARSDEYLEFLAKRLAKVHPIGRMGRARDVAEAACFLASDASDFINGVALPIDGGSSAVSLGSFGTLAQEATQQFLEN